MVILPNAEDFEDTIPQEEIPFLIEKIKSNWEEIIIACLEEGVDIDLTKSDDFIFLYGKPSLNLIRKVCDFLGGCTHERLQRYDRKTGSWYDLNVWLIIPFYVPQMIFDGG